MVRATIPTARALAAALGFAVLAVLAVLLAGAPAAPAARGGASPPAASPCQGRQAAHLRCPDLRIAPPHDIYVQVAGGQVRLRATSDVRSRGKGPMELHGVRNGPRTMRVRQRIYKASGGHITVPTPATLRFTDVGSYFGGGYWKVHDLANFELWSVDGRHHNLRLVRRGPKLNYCLRDLEHTRPGRRSPSHWHYPGCNQNPQQDRVRLGTSVGWSDVYPADYHQQWIDVSGLHGCFAFVMRVDPAGLLYESHEDNNSSRTLVRLPYPGHPGC